jgi:hypothetical protein
MPTTIRSTGYSRQPYVPPAIPDNQLGLFDINGEQMLIDLAAHSPTFTLDLSDENAGTSSRFGDIGLDNIINDEEIEQFLETM